jgi:hypothetical protein
MKLCVFYNPEDEDGNLSFRQFQINVTSCSIYNMEYLVLCSFLADSDSNFKYHNLNDTILNNGGQWGFSKRQHGTFIYYGNIVIRKAFCCCCCCLCCWKDWSPIGSIVHDVEDSTMQQADKALERRGGSQLGPEPIRGTLLNKNNESELLLGLWRSPIEVKS